MRTYKILNIVLKIFSFLFVAYFLCYIIIHLPKHIEEIEEFKKLIQQALYPTEIYEEAILTLKKQIVFMLISFICSVVLFFVLWIKDCCFLTNSIIASIKTHNRTRKEKKKQRLEKSIKHKQYLLTKINKDDQ